MENSALTQMAQLVLTELGLQTTTGFTFPSADGANGYVLKTNGSGTVSWAPDSNTGTVTGTGAANRVTYWDSATNVTSDAGFTYNGTGRVSTDESFNVLNDGADTVADGPFFALKNAAATRQYLWQLDASNNIDYWYYNGSTWTQTISLLNNGGATFSGAVTITDSTVPLVLNNLGGQFTQISIQNNGTQNAALWLDETNDEFVMYANTGKSIEFHTNGSAKPEKKILSNGNVGIGTTTPDFKLQIEGGTNTEETVLKIR